MKMSTPKKCLPSQVCTCLTCVYTHREVATVTYKLPSTCSLLLRWSSFFRFQVLPAFSDHPSVNLLLLLRTTTAFNVLLHIMIIPGWRDAQRSESHSWGNGDGSGVWARWPQTPATGLSSIIRRAAVMYLLMSCHSYSNSINWCMHYSGYAARLHGPTIQYCTVNQHCLFVQ